MPSRPAACLLAALALVDCASSSSETPRAAQGTATRRDPPGPVRHVVVVTLDGLLPDSYLHPDAHGLRVPALRAMVARGAVSDGALSVFPSVTYPSHTSIVTGVSPGAHGIEGNLVFDPLEQSLEGWSWYAEDIKRDPVWRLLERAGYAAALVNWPVSVNAGVTWLFPEYWRARDEGDPKLLRALSTPGLLERAAAAHPRFWERYTGGRKDDVVTDLAADILASGKPAALFLHLADVDGAQHHFGLWSPEALAAIESDDAELARLVQALDAAGLSADSVVVVASDHGFMNAPRMVRPGVLLRDAGLVTVNPAGRPVAWKASLLTSGGQAYVYLRDPADQASATLARKLFADKAAEPGSGIGRVYDAAAIREVGGDPAALLALEASPGVQLGGGFGGSYDAPTSYKATHGYDPRRPEMRASLLVAGATIPHGTLRDAKLVDIAPSVAKWLGVPMPGVEGKPLEVVPGP